MDLSFKLELSSDPSTLDALTKYRALIDYLMNHPNVPDDEKLGLEFCQLNSNRFVRLQTYYRGVYKVKDLTSLRTSKDYIQILVQKTVPDMIFEFIEHENTITVLTDGLMQTERALTEGNEQRPAADETPEVKILAVTTMNKQTVLDDDIESEYERKLVQAAAESEGKAHYQTPIRQVNAGPTSVASSVTTRQSSARKSDKGSISDKSALIEPNTVLVPTPVTPGQTTINDIMKKSETGPTTNTASDTGTAKTLIDVSQPVLSQGGTLLQKGLFNLNTMPDTEETEASSAINLSTKVPTVTEVHDFPGNEGEVPGNNKTDMTKTNAKDNGSETLTDLNDFIPVERGIKATERENIADSTNDKQVSTALSKRRDVNSFAVLGDDDDENADDKAAESVTEDETSVDLLATVPTVPSQRKIMFDKIRSNIARTPATNPKKPSPKTNVTQSQMGKIATKTKEKSMIPGTFSYNDKKLREQKNGYDYIANRLQQNRHHEVSLNDMAWYITKTKPRMANIRSQLTSECDTIQAAAVEECIQSCKAAWENTTMELAKISNAECNKLNNTSSKILREMKKADVMQTNLLTTHDMCSKLMGEMKTATTNLVTRYEMQREVEKMKIEINNSARKQQGEWNLKHAQLRTDIIALQGYWMNAKDDDNPMEVTITGGSETHKKDNHNDDPLNSLNSQAVRSQLRHLERTVQEHRTLLTAQQTEIQLLRNQVRDQANELTGLVSRKSMETQTGRNKPSDDNELAVLKCKVIDIQDKLNELLHGKTIQQPTTPPRSRFFPNVDPASIKRPTIPTRGTVQRETEDSKPEHVPSLSSHNNKVHRPDTVLPFGTKVMVRLKGESHECWIQKCYRTQKGLEYDGSTSGGDLMQFQPTDIFLHDLTSTPTKTPANYIVDITGGYDLQSSYETYHDYHQESTPTFQRPAYNRHNNDIDQDSEGSEHHLPQQYQVQTHGRKGRNMQFAQNSFAHPRGSVPQYIREDKASTLGKNFAGHLSPDVDPRIFFDAVRQEVLVQKILLRPYEDITKTTGLLEINAHNCDNFQEAKKTMSRFLYNFFFQGRDTMFDGNDYAHNSLSVYAIDQDGLTFLEDLIRDSHPQLRTEVHRASITNAFKLPEFTDDISVWKYITLMQIYCKEVNRHISQVDILRLIHDQLLPDERFKRAVEHLQERISEHKSGNGMVPAEYRLKSIAQTIMTLYPPKKRQALSQTRQQLGLTSRMINAVDDPSVVTNIAANRMATRSQTRTKSNQTNQQEEQRYRDPLNSDDNRRQEYAYLPDDYDRQLTVESQSGKHRGYHFKPIPPNVQDDARPQRPITPKHDNHEHHDKGRFLKPPPNEKFCNSCITYGHTDAECTKTGAHISIEEYLRQCPKERKQEILRAYRRNRKEAHERYKAAYQRRRDLRKRIRRIEHQHHYDLDGTYKDLEPATAASLDRQRISCIRIAHEQHPDLDFGTLDEDYVDMTEPILNFDPAVDNVPHVDE